MAPSGPPTRSLARSPDLALCDADLVRRCVDGEETAWALLVGRYADVVYGVARRAGHGQADAGDVVQEVFVSLLRALPKLRRSERLLAWILRTARREAWRQARLRRSGRRREQAVSRAEDAGEAPVDLLAGLEREQAVREAFGALGERCRRLLDALFFRSPPRPYAAIAEEIGMPVGSIGPTRQRCLERLRAGLEVRGFGPPEGSDVSAPPPGASGKATRRRP